MNRTELSERSPLRHFDQSMHGGLGRGQLGIVASRRGVGKTPFLVHVALDALLRERRVLHLSHEHTVDHVRAYYDEIFLDLAERSRLEDAEAVRLDIERRRLIYSTLGYSSPSLVPPAGEGWPIFKIVESMRFAREVAQFQPELVIVDGLDFAQANERGVAALADVARQADAELWASATVAEGADRVVAGELPPPLDRFRAELACVVFLEPEPDFVHPRLLKDHDHEPPGEMRLRFEPHTMRILNDTSFGQSERSRDPRRFHLISGGGVGAEAEFGACAERWGLRETNYSFDGHLSLERRRGVVVLGEAELEKGDFSLVYVSRRLGRTLSGIPSVRKVLQSICHQISDANQVFVVGTIQPDGTVRGGTGWGAELARLWKKPLYVFDQDKNEWCRWNGSAWEFTAAPLVSAESFAGIGTQKLRAEGQAAIRALFERSFGPAS
jgi:archaellum biogenesis ATPase FlaH